MHANAGAQSVCGPRVLNPRAPGMTSVHAPHVCRTRSDVPSQVSWSIFQIFHSLAESFRRVFHPPSTRKGIHKPTVPATGSGEQ
jgi:hypothetical protein